MALSRSEQMSRIPGQDTSLNACRSALWRAGLVSACSRRTPYGRPDVVFPKARVAAFIEGCSWHGCPGHYVRPRTRNEFWSSKLLENVERDRRQTLQLESEAGASAGSGAPDLRVLPDVWRPFVPRWLTSSAARLFLEGRAGRCAPGEGDMDSAGWRI